MNCNDLKEAAHAYFGGSLPAAERKRFEAHAAGCGDCTAFLAICRELTCRELTEFLDDFLEGELDAARRAVFERHLSICQECSNYLQSYRATRRLGRAAHAADALAEMPEALVRAILAARKPS